MSAKVSLFYVIFMFFVLVALDGCVSVSSSTFGLQKRMEVEQLFESGTLLPDHTYYIDGSEVEPDAIIAISKKFHLQTKIWTRREWTAEEFKKAVFWMQTGEYGFCNTEGGVLIAPDGQQIGFWYSKRDIGTIRQPAPGTVEVFPFKFRPGSPCSRQDMIDDL
ncbi:hypothetical protein UWK_01867 [Desulfocapsa sulfexigens DSM 10523]|uniref:Uncharacterized protein n=1 Tax=Desulfocapsa sulfexigens (strain DSM 10523 / SB164P1) TaxID=1167006 RepID=M1NFJ0_DESSD|nr:hypothetical protein [Desulfocapsa sulfexigens]AGF78424.1 hypothetical protein UWK_01867 [Desulfocapsa sulfexigens DSM 10523]